MRLERQLFTLSTGQKGWAEYDPEGDVLEITFQSAEATCAVELTESVILRLDYESGEPLSLSFISVSRLAQAPHYGAVRLPLLVEQWPDEIREKVYDALQRAPLTDLVAFSEHDPLHGELIVPLETLDLARTVQAQQYRIIAERPLDGQGYDSKG